MKRFLAVLLILTMMFAMTGCKKSSSAEDDTVDNVDDIIATLTPDDDVEYTIDDDGYIVESGEYDEELVDDTSDIVESNYSVAYEYEYETYFDFGFSASQSFTMQTAVVQQDYSDLSLLTSTLESLLASALSNAIGGTYEIFSDYDEDDEEEIDKLAYAIGMENDDAEARFAECGAYHTTSGKYYQYITVISENFTTVTDADLESIMDIAQSGFGITLSKSRLQKAIEIAYGVALETEDYYSLYQIKTISGNGYTETIKMYVDGFATEDDEIGYYVGFERERCYS